MVDQEWLASLLGIPGKVAVVTDCEGLVRNDVSETLARAGASVVVADRDQEAVEALVDRIKSAGGDARAILTDIEQEDEVIALFRSVREQFGRLDILVNCAGVTANQPLTETSLEHWEVCQSINLRATFFCFREGVKAMLEAGNGGRIVTTSTVGAIHPVVHGNQAYSSSRAGVTMLTKTTALDYAKDGILANVLLPAFIPGHARIHETTLQAMQNGRLFQGPAMRGEEWRLLCGNGAPQDIATAVLYLVGPSGSFITGQTLIMDGGFSVS